MFKDEKVEGCGSVPEMFKKCERNRKIGSRIVEHHRRVSVNGCHGVEEERADNLPSVGGEASMCWRGNHSSQLRDC